MAETIVTGTRAQYLEAAKAAQALIGERTATVTDPRYPGPVHYYNHPAMPAHGFVSLSYEDYRSGVLLAMKQEGYDAANLVVSRFPIASMNGVRRLGKNSINKKQYIDPYDKFLQSIGFHGAEALFFGRTVAEYFNPDVDHPAKRGGYACVLYRKDLLYQVSDTAFVFLLPKPGVRDTGRYKLGLGHVALVGIVSPQGRVPLPSPQRGSRRLDW